MIYTFDEYFANFQHFTAIRVDVACYRSSNSQYLGYPWQGEEGWHISEEKIGDTRADLRGYIVPNQSIRRFICPDDNVNQQYIDLLYPVMYEAIFGKGGAIEDQLIIDFGEASSFPCFVLQEDTAFYSLEGEPETYPAGWVVYKTNRPEWDSNRPDGYTACPLALFFVHYYVILA